MKENNMIYWRAFCAPPPSALKEIKAGRLAGKTDINPQWRLQAMTEVFGPIGIGWNYRIVRLWTEKVDETKEILAFAEISLRIKTQEGWSEEIPGIGGATLVAQERHGPYASDEAYKMAVTDALSVAMKQLGVAADIYLGKHESKYTNTRNPISHKDDDL